MTQISSMTAWEAVDTLLAIRDEEALETALAAAGPAITARAVAAAPSLEQKTALLWAMEDRQRQETLELVPPALIGALVQNLEDDNRYLLGDLSLEQFRALLSLCSPERKYYWITTALSFTDARANALPLLLTTRELVDILSTRAEFEEHVRALGDYALENERLPSELMTDPAQTLIDLYGAENLLRRFPISDASLAALLQTILEYDPDRYVDLVREGLRAADYAENHPLEWAALSEDPILLDHLAPIRRVEAEPLAEEETEEADGPPLALVPIGALPLARLAAALPPAQRARVSDEMQYLYIRQAIAEGGSFHLADLERTARSVEAYLLLGLRAESGGRPDAEPAVLASRPLHKVAQSGARLVEHLRQTALRIRPLEKVLSPAQRAIVRSLVSPRLKIGAGGEPRLSLFPAEGLPEEAGIHKAASLLREVVIWTGIARSVGLERTENALRTAKNMEAVLEELALAALLYGRVELGLVEAGDPARLAELYLSPVAKEPLPEARERLRQTVASWAQPRSLDLPPTLELFDKALERLALQA